MDLDRSERSFDELAAAVREACDNAVNSLERDIAARLCLLHNPECDPQRLVVTGSPMWLDHCRSYSFVSPANIVPFWVLFLPQAQIALRSVKAQI
jgi:hypothetical protein